MRSWAKFLSYTLGGFRRSYLIFGPSFYKKSPISQSHQPIQSPKTKKEKHIQIQTPKIVDLTTKTTQAWIKPFTKNIMSPDQPNPNDRALTKHQTEAQCIAAIHHLIIFHHFSATWRNLGRLRGPQPREQLRICTNVPWKKAAKKKMPREVIKREWDAMRCLLIFLGGWKYVFVLKVKGVLLFCSFFLSNVIIDFEQYPLPPRRSQLIRLFFNHSCPPTNKVV